MKKFKTGRYWINQPSKLQPYHERHGENVIAAHYWEHKAEAFPLSGEIHSFIIPILCLSKGWKTKHSSSINDMALDTLYKHHGEEIL